jgi:hypothetical protein
MKKNNDRYGHHSHEFSEGTFIGNYRVIQHTASEILAEHPRTGEFIQLEHVGDKLVCKYRG